MAKSPRRIDLTSATWGVLALALGGLFLIDDAGLAEVDAGVATATVLILLTAVNLARSLGKLSGHLRDPHHPDLSA